MQTLKGPGRDPEPVTKQPARADYKGLHTSPKISITQAHIKRKGFIMEDSNINIMQISKLEYEHLVRQSERIRILERMLADSKKRYIDDDFIRQVLNQPLRDKE